MRNPGYNIPDWVGKISYQCNQTPDRDSYVLYRDGKLPRTQRSIQSQFLMMISPISSHLSLSRPQVYHHRRTRSQVIPLYLSMP